jgi:hypothetical protein
MLVSGLNLLWCFLLQSGVRLIHAWSSLYYTKENNRLQMAWSCNTGPPQPPDSPKKLKKPGASWEELRHEHRGSTPQKSQGLRAGRRMLDVSHKPQGLMASPRCRTLYNCPLPAPGPRAPAPASPGGRQGSVLQFVYPVAYMIYDITYRYLVSRGVWTHPTPRHQCHQSNLPSPSPPIYR